MSTILDWFWTAVAWLAGWLWTAVVWLAGWIWAPFGWAAESFVGNYWIVGLLIVLFVASGLVSVVLLWRRFDMEEELRSSQRRVERLYNLAVEVEQTHRAIVQELRDRLDKTPEEVRRENNRLRAELRDKEQLMGEIKELRKYNRQFTDQVEQLKQQNWQLSQANKQLRHENRLLNAANDGLRDDLRRRR